MLTKDRCPICDSEPKNWRTKRTSRGNYAVDRCLKCDYAFVNPRPTPAELRQLYQKSVGQGALSREAAKAILEAEHAAPNSTLDARRMLDRVETRLSPQLPRTFLDIGCGYGFFSKEALDRGFTVTALDGAPDERQFAAVTFGLEPRNAWFEEAEFEGRFSVVLMSQVLEHVHDVNVWIRKAHGLLNQGGILCIALPNFASIVRRVLSERDPLICPPVHLNFFTRQSLERLLLKEGFSGVSFEDVSRMPLQSIRKRLPASVAGLIGAPIHRLVNNAFGLCDRLGMGQMLNAYAVRS